MGTNEILGNPLNKEDILKQATEENRRPSRPMWQHENIQPSMRGLVVSVMEGNRGPYGKLPIKNHFNFIALVPNFELSTSKAREVLPKQIDYKDRIFKCSPG